MTTALAWISSRLKISSLLLVVLTLIASACLVAGVFEVVEGLDQALIVRLVLLAFLAGYFFGKWIRSGWAGIALGLAAGSFGLWFRLGQLGDKAWLVFRQAGEYIRTLKSSLTPGSSPLVEVSAAWNALQTSVSGVSLRIATWFVDYAHGEAFYDPVAVLFFWGVLLWAAVFWIAWATQRRYQAIHILLPSLILLAVLLGYANHYSHSILIFLATFLLLCILSPHIVHEETWQRAQIDFSLEIRLDLAMVSLPIIVAILTMALVIPSISINEITSAFQYWTQSQDTHGETIGQPLGLHPQPRQIVNHTFIDFESPGLPRSHLIGSGPELSQKAVMTVQTVKPSAEIATPKQQLPVHYWRGTTYDRYTGAGWLTSGFQVETVLAGNRLLTYDPVHFRSFKQEIHLVENVGNIAYYSGILVSANQPFEAAMRSKEDVFAVSIRSREYIVESAVPEYPRQYLATAGRDYPGWVRQKYLQLPAGLPDRVRSLARDITATAITPYDQAKAIETFLRNYPYTLALPAPPANKDIVDYFLFDLKKGYCDYYASSMVVLARSIGLPARLVIGYASGTYDAGALRYVVTEANAHSWPEIYFPSYGWVEFEPTAVLATPEGFPERQVLPEEQAEPQFPAGEQSPGPASPVQRWIAWALTGLFGAGFFGLLVWRKIQAYRLAHLPPERIAVHLYRQLVSYARRIRTPIATGDTPLEFSERVKIRLSTEWGQERDLYRKTEALRQLDALVWLYVQSSYSPDQPTRGQAVQGIEGWSRLRGSLLALWIKQKLSRN
ncbi:MAG TPA: transglutaminase-like domain-containing protein [Anaerolineaceae bacterium]|nr:transglutaminase-like domain-containing protein [Anaerolineaceae bacterium]